jgi:hypothetical protein
MGQTLSQSTKNVAFYERELTQAFTETRRVLRQDGVGTIVFASKTTASWEAILLAIVEAGWTITGSWPIDTEMETRVAAQGQARLGSSVHLVCRPRVGEEVGDWRDVLAELPNRINEWLPRLASEGIIGADAIFACLGPALEIFSRYRRVEKPSGEEVTLPDYLEHVWAAVAKAALSMIFSGADASGLEPDARLTAMWFWTLSTSGTTRAGANGEGENEEEEEPAGDDEGNGKKAKATGYSLEFDAARKIAQGLGAHLEQLGKVVEVKGDTARLLSIRERAGHLFGKEAGKAPVEKGKGRGRKPSQADLFSRSRKPVQQDMFDDAPDRDDAARGGDRAAPPPGETVLDRIHQAMILFGLGRAEAMKHFLVEEGAGRDPRFWKLAQSLSALYPPGTEEKRWVDGVLARKKGLGF